MDLDLSIVIPVYNEERILETAISELHAHLSTRALSFEILIAENGSTDATVAIAQRLRARLPEVNLLRVGEPNYGKALRQGMLAARGRIVICEEIDLCDTDFHLRAIQLLDDDRAEMVIGSKLCVGAQDERPLLRHAASLLYSSLLRHLLGFRGTDTHGLKAFRRDAVLDTVRACLVDRDVFASEFVIRAYRANLRVLEIPVTLREKRPPSINLFKRVPNVLKNLAKLSWVIHTNTRTPTRRR